MCRFFMMLLFSSSVVPDLCNPMDCSTPGFPVLHHLQEFAQTHVQWAGDAIQPSHALSSLSSNLTCTGPFQGPVSNFLFKVLILFFQEGSLNKLQGPTQPRSAPGYTPLVIKSWEKESHTTLDLYWQGLEAMWITRVMKEWQNHWSNWGRFSRKENKLYTWQQTQGTCWWWVIFTTESLSGSIGLLL